MIRFLRALPLWLCVALLQACAGLPENTGREHSTAWATPGQTPLGMAVQAPAGVATVRGDSGFRLIASPQDALNTRLAMIQATSKTLDLQYYAIRADESTAELIEHLRGAAQRGVRVRILLDDLNSVGADAQVLTLSFEKNIEIRLFNPLTGSRSSLLTRGLGSVMNLSLIQRRMHNKLFLADNAMAIVGGRNLGDAYFGRDPTANYVDLDMLITGPVVRPLSASFDAYWNDPLAYPVETLISPQVLRDLKTTSVAKGESRPILAATVGRSTDASQMTSDSAAALDYLNQSWIWCSAVVLADKPEKISDDEDDPAQETVIDGLLTLMLQAQHDVLIISPYFVPGKEMMGVFSTLRQRGVSVRVLTNSLASNDATLAHIGYAKYRQRLLETGVQLHEMRSEHQARLSSFGSSSASNSKLHVKAVIVDGRTLAIGSMNLDLRSHLYNTELALVIRSRALATGTASRIEPEMTKGAYRVELLDGRLVWRAPAGSGLDDSWTEPDSNFMMRLLLKLLGPLAPEELL